MYVICLFLKNGDSTVHCSYCIYLKYCSLWRIKKSTQKICSLMNFLSTQSMEIRRSKFSLPWGLSKCKLCWTKLFHANFVGQNAEQIIFAKILDKTFSWNRIKTYLYTLICNLHPNTYAVLP